MVDREWLFGEPRRLDRMFGWDKGGLKGKNLFENSCIQEPERSPRQEIMLGARF